MARKIVRSRPQNASEPAIPSHPAVYDSAIRPSSIKLTTEITASIGKYTREIGSCSARRSCHCVSVNRAAFSSIDSRVCSSRRASTTFSHIAGTQKLLPACVRFRTDRGGRTPHPEETWPLKNPFQVFVIPKPSSPKSCVKKASIRPLHRAHRDRRSFPFRDYRSRRLGGEQNERKFTRKNGHKQHTLFCFRGPIAPCAAR